MGSYKMAAANALDAAEKSGGVILDVRTVAEHEDCSLKRPHDLVPLDRLDPKDFMLRRGLDRNADVYMLCRGGTRAKAAAEKFVAAGYPNIHVIEGGIMACESSGEPVNGSTGAAAAPATASAKKVIPLERQVRIAAGALVALGAAISLTGHPAFAALPLFVGLGLIYAGITDRCGMALVLMKAPWNRGSGAACGTVKPDAIPASSGKAGGCA